MPNRHSPPEEAVAIAETSTTTTVVVELDRDGRHLADLVHSIDRQSAASADFETIFAGVPAHSPLASRLAGLAARRPNVRVAASGTSQAVAEAAGRWILHVPAGLCAAGARLQPEAVTRLAAFASGSDCDALLGRVDVAAGSRANDLLIDDVPRLPNLPSEALDPALVLYRREFAAEHGLASNAKAAAALLAGAAVGAAGSYPALLLPGRPDPARALAVDRVSATWQDGSALITASGRAGAGPADRRVVWSIRHADSGLDFWLDGTGDVAADGAFSGTVRVDPRTAALGAELAPGPWVVRVGVHGSGGAWSPRIAVPATALGSAILDGLLVAVDANAPALTLDVGSTRTSVVGALSAADVAIEESARGTVLTAALPDLCVTGGARTSGHLVLGKFPLPAYVEADGGRASLTCHLSGLPGRSALSTRFGRKAAPTGLDLRIDEVGGMTVAPTPPHQSPAAKGTAASATRSMRVRRLRQAVPAPLEPAVRKLASNPTARRLYHRLGGIGR